MRNYNSSFLSNFTVHPEAKNFPLVKQKPFNEKLKVDMKKVQIMFEVENLDFHVPRLCVKAALTAEIEDWSKQVKYNH